AQAIVATGRRRRAAAGSGWVGLKAHFRGLPARPAIELFTLRGGYCGLAPVESGETNLSCLLRARGAPPLADSRDLPAWLAQVPGSPGLLARLRGGEQATPTAVTAGILLGPDRAGTLAAPAAGDACGFLDPFTGDGIARALLSGQLAAELVACRQTARYAPALHHGSRYGTARLLRPLLTAPAWAQALACRTLLHPLLAPHLFTATRWRTCKL
ncbi:MAG: hypothetical protein ACRD04_04770, partial [Terriglobales bacterium]